MDMNNTFIQNVKKLKETVIWRPVRDTDFYKYSAYVIRDDGQLVEVFRVYVPIRTKYWTFDANSLPIHIFLNPDIPIIENLSFNDLNIEPIVTEDNQEFKNKLIKAILRYFNV